MATTETALLERVREALEEELRPLVDQLLEPTVRRLVRERLNGHAGDASVAPEPEPEPELEAPATKTCTSCGETKPLGAFGPQRAQWPRLPRRLRSRAGRPARAGARERNRDGRGGARARAGPFGAAAGLTPGAGLELDRIAPTFPRDVVGALLRQEVRRGRVLEEGGRYRLVDGALAPSVARALVGLEPPDPRGGDR